MVALLWPRLAGGAGLVIERNAYVHRRHFWVMVSGFAEPLFYLLSLGLGMGQLVGRMPLGDGRSVPYAVFVAPAMLATAAMTGAVVESTYNVFAKFKFMKLYDGVLATPVTPAGIAYGEIGWAVIRGALYSGAFLAIMAAMGLAPSGWAVLAFPAAVLVCLACAAAGMAATTYMRSWQDFDYVTGAIFVLFLFSGTFAPISAYPEWLQALVVLTPLYHGVVLIRGLTTGVLSPELLWHAGYLVGLAALGLAVSAYRMRRLLAP